MSTETAPSILLPDPPPDQHSAHPLQLLAITPPSHHSQRSTDTAATSHFAAVQQIFASASALPLRLARDLDDEHGVGDNAECVEENLDDAERVEENLATPSASPPQPSTNEHMSPPAEEPVSPLDDLRHYIDQDEFFGLLQDDGVSPRPDETEMFNDDRKKSRAKHIRFGDRLYPKIWQLSSCYYKAVLKKHRNEIVTKMSKNDSDNIKYLGQAIIEMRFRKGRGDLHSAAADHVQMELVTHDAMHCELEFVYFLSQRELLKWALGRWSPTMDDKKRATDDDRLRLLLIMFTEEMRPWIRYLLSAKDPNDRLELDAWTGKRNTAQHLLHTKGIDPDVVVSMPNLWTTDAARQKVDSHYGTKGVYNALQFNPNNPARINMPWTKKESTAIVASVLVHYRKMMELYTKGTGGGDGDPVAYSVWQERDPHAAVTYK